MGVWRFAIDVGGTFTDVVALRPDGKTLTYKLLSTGAVRGMVEAGSTGAAIVDRRRVGEAPALWIDYELRLLRAGSPADPPDSKSSTPRAARVTGFDPQRGVLSLSGEWPGVAIESVPGVPGTSAPSGYELFSKEPAPVTAIRHLMGLRLSDPIGPVEVRLGTTRATNALLERKGAKTAFVTTRGFRDVLKIGYQDRPRLFDLAIRKRDELASTVIEIDARMDADGAVLTAPDADLVRNQLTALAENGVESLAICLLHSHVNPAHEESVAEIAAKVGFRHVSVSSRVARLERIVPRGDTTVVDAYLAPVIHEYIRHLRRSLPEANLLMMTSNGGLVMADGAAGKDTVLSGPAGGVVGCRATARSAGFGKTIGFDMGGTSTDVCRIDEPPNEFEYQHETTKAGVRLMTPMLAVETVAAGGGSICSFDGQKLTVGPESAGADPGPACYGRGGPLTVTDVNLYLGRIVPAHFPFPLDRMPVDAALMRLVERVNAATGQGYDPATLAEGLVRIANEHMAAAIKQISTARGYDVREYVLTTFGGAGAQHACAIAQRLGITRVLCSPFAGVLSAVGMAATDVKRIAQRSILERLDGVAGRRLAAIFPPLEEQAKDEILSDGVPAERIGRPVRSVDLCYAGQSTFITVPAEPVEQIVEEFERQHRQLYGYCHAGRSVEAHVARVELTASTPAFELRAPIDADQGDSRECGQVYSDGEWVNVPIMPRRGLAVGARMQGPAVLIEDTSTIVIDRGWRGEVLAQGEVLLTHERAGACEAEASAICDPIQLELFNSRFAAIAEQMGHTLRRTALSVNVKERLDFSCAIFTPAGDLVVNAPHIPVHLGGMSDCVKCLIADVGGFEPGDVYITNDPFRGGSHLNDVTVITPVHDSTDGRLLFFTASRAHHAEIGGTRPGSMPPDSTCLAEEGVLIRTFRLMRGGRPRMEEFHRMLTAVPYPSRSPEENLADVTAQVAANQTGVRELHSLMARHGRDVVHAYMQHIQEAAERSMRRALARVPDGTYRFTDCLDDGTPIQLAVAIAGDAAVFDFSGTAPVMRGNLNANASITRSAVLYCLRCLIDEELPLNGGVLGPIQIVLPNCFLNPPAHEDPRQCAAVVGGNVETSQRIVDCVFGALGTVAASQGTMNNLLLGNERFGYYETICGGAGAGPGFDGADAVHTNMTNTRLTDPEVLERRVPVRLERFEIRRGSGGAGRWRGGCGVIRELVFLETLEVSILSQRRSTAPYGLHGGGAGRPGRNLVKRAGTDRLEVLPSIASFTARPGDHLIIETPGGGGWGTDAS